MARNPLARSLRSDHLRHRVIPDKRQPRRGWRVHYDEDGLCTMCGHPGTGFVADGVCECLD